MPCRPSRAPQPRRTGRAAWFRQAECGLITAPICLTRAANARSHLIGYRAKYSTNRMIRGIQVWAYMAGEGGQCTPALARHVRNIENNPMQSSVAGRDAVTFPAPLRCLRRETGKEKVVEVQADEGNDVRRSAALGASADRHRRPGNGEPEASDGGRQNPSRSSRSTGTLPLICWRGCPARQMTRCPRRPAADLARRR
jgi:hypothetical protein